MDNVKAKIRNKKILSSLNWNNLIKSIPNEKVIFDQKNHYDVAKAPYFDEWMKEDE